ncbi:MAG: flotillin family protein [bacterium]|nr:flotillin family protein [bacterium]
MDKILDTLFSSGIVITLLIFVVIVGVLFMMTRFLRKVEPGKALIIISPFRGMKVTFTGSLVFPIIHKMEIMDISTKMITVERRGKDGLICKDNMRADISVNFYLRVNPTKEDVTQVGQSIGVERASAQETLNDLFQAKFSEGLKTVGKQMDFEDLFQERTAFKERILETIGQNLNGYSLEDTAIDYLEQTPMADLDEDNIMDAEGIRKITEITLTKKEIVEKRTTETRERILELEKQRLEAEAKQKSEISIIRSKEEAMAKRVSEEERLKADGTRINTDEKLAVAEVNKNRQVEVAEKNREREVAVETERVEKDRSLEATDREKLVALARIEKDKVVEQERKNIADIVRQRVIVERTVAEEEEATKDTRAFAGADREKRVAVTHAEQEAEEKLVIEIKSAEAKEKSATHLAKQKEINAEVELTTASKLAESKKTLAQGVIAENSANGLAQVKVKEADADAIKKTGEAEAKASEYKFIVEAKGIKEKGLAEVEVRNAGAEATERMGQAEAKALQYKYEADAKGMLEKADAMKNYDSVGKEHEEYKLQLAFEEKIKMEQLNIRRDVAQAQAKVISTALESAKIDIVGGDGEFFDKLITSISDGKAATAYIDNNEPLTEIKNALLASGDDNLVNKIKALAKETGLSSEAIKNLTVSAVLGKIATSSDSSEILDKAVELKEISEKVGIGGVNIKKLMG